MWRDFVEASKTADFESKRLSMHARGDALALLVHGLKINHDRGVVVVGEPRSGTPTFEMSPPLAPTEAVVRDCASDEDWLRVNKKTGKSATDTMSMPGWHRVDATLTKTGLSWKVAKLRIWETGSCGA